MRESRGSVGADKQQSIHHQLPPQRKCSAGACPHPTARPLPIALVPPDPINREAMQQRQEIYLHRGTMYNTSMYNVIATGADSGAVLDETR